ncbi:uncharacterized protein LOC124813343 [Hydra vulgaris]|uniref:Uncharacterized protein LOC124813343 n=1 Tax=Hydra vulgaris TaxID=6087 RepID=A0ABM4CUZ9_HYDVU
MHENEPVYVVDMNKEVQRAKWFKEDLEKSGWRMIFTKPGETFWIKTILAEKIKTKILYKLTLPMPGEMFAMLLHPENLETRREWDHAFKEHKMLEKLPNGGYITYTRAILPWPLADRDFVLFVPPAKEIDWYGKKSLFLVQKNAIHEQKPVDQVAVRATNGGDFCVIIPDINQPHEKCEIFGLSNNSYNGSIPDCATKCVVANSVPQLLDTLISNMITKYNQQINHK